MFFAQHLVAKQPSILGAIESISTTTNSDGNPKKRSSPSNISIETVDKKIKLSETLRNQDLVLEEKCEKLQDMLIVVAQDYSALKTKLALVDDRLKLHLNIGETTTTLRIQEFAQQLNRTETVLDMILTTQRNIVQQLKTLEERVSRCEKQDSGDSDVLVQATPPLIEQSQPNSVVIEMKEVVEMNSSTQK
jgi:hypothetical protein